MGRDYQAIVESLFCVSNQFTSGQFARAANISPGRASVVLAQLVSQKVLYRPREGQRSKYARHTSPEADDNRNPFWIDVVEFSEGVIAYKDVATFKPSVRFGSQARKLLDSIGNATFVILDFKNVARTTETFFWHLFRTYPHLRIEPINLSKEHAVIMASARRRRAAPIYRRACRPEALRERSRSPVTSSEWP
jgi:hypothetical protein